ncbi:putative metal-binding motif-containing protein [Solirubrobacter sp. CPCC 204708]|uniref:putative metal-binding motif-containing protein n=1 Tax=Solirubrobacter deserti TaxID=2282478 RepID=UPI001930BDF2|nr:putative metal-binding motif-containing protein [Solirubrobacter deserti]MBE2316562.1 putative metal-binding motif-containing protein [Solirubrobacter deserti]
MSVRGAALLVAVALASVGAPGSARAAVGADNHGDAPALTLSAPGTVADTLGYTTQAAEPVSGSTGCELPSTSMSRTAWWRFTGTGVPVTLSTRASTFNTVLAVYDAPGAPIAGNRVACNDDESVSITTSALTFTAARGKRYLVQVGSRGTAPRGAIDLRASAARPPNDDRIAAQPLSPGTPALVDNTGASQETGETTTCATASYAATMWFTFRAGAVGDAVFSSTAAFGDTVVTVYRETDGAHLGCNAGTTASLPLRLTAGDYLVQVGTKGSDVAGLGTGPIATTASFTADPDVDNDGDPASTDCDDRNASIRHGIVDTPDDGIDQNCDGADTVILDRDGDGDPRSGDCNDANPAIRRGAGDAPDDGVDQNCDGADAVNLDRDADGESRPGDCNDGNPAIRHGARDIPGNAVDEDCSGSPAPYPRVDSAVRISWRFSPFRIATLTIVRAVPGSRVEIRCRGGGCPFKRETVTVRKAAAERSVLSRKLKRARLQRKAVLEIRITLDGHVGFMRRATVRTMTKDPKLAEFCLPPGAARPARCDVAGRAGS